MYILLMIANTPGIFVSTPMILKDSFDTNVNPSITSNLTSSAVLTPTSNTVEPGKRGSVQPKSVESDLQSALERIKTLQSACDGYRSELERLNQLRQRRMESGSAGSATTSTLKIHQSKIQSHAQGVPMQTVIMAMLISFLVGIWLF